MGSGGGPPVGGRDDDPQVGGCHGAAWDRGFACTVAQDACVTRDLVFDGALIRADQVRGAFRAAMRGTCAAVREAASGGVE